MIKANTKFVNLNSSTLLKGDLCFTFIFLKNDRGQDLEFIGIDNKIFNGNLVLVESHLPKILSEVVKIAFFSEIKSLTFIVDELERKDPFGFYDVTDTKYYRYKIKEFLRHLALGLTANTIYYGEPNLYEHYPVIRKQDRIIYYWENIEVFLNILINGSILNITNTQEFIREEKSYIGISFEILINIT